MPLHHSFHGNLQSQEEFVENSKSMLFDGIDEYTTAGNASDFNFQYADLFSVSVWVKTTTDIDSAPVIISKQEGNGNFQGWAIKIQQADARIKFQMLETGSNFIDRFTNTSSGVDDGNWHHIVTTYDGSKTGEGIKIYLDGTEQGYSLTRTSPGAGDTDSSAFFNIGIIGDAGSAIIDPYDGNIDEPSIWNKELSAAEVTEIYNSGTPTDLSTHSASGNIISWWRMGDDPLDDSTANTGVIKDQVGSNDCTPKNTEVGDIVSDVP